HHGSRRSRRLEGRTCSAGAPAQAARKGAGGVGQAVPAVFGVVHLRRGGGGLGVILPRGHRLGGGGLAQRLGGRGGCAGGRLLPAAAPQQQDKAERRAASRCAGPGPDVIFHTKTSFMRRGAAAVF